MSRNPSGENGVVEAELDALRAAGHDVHLVAARTDDLEGDPTYPLRAAVRVATSRGRDPLDELAAFAPDVVHVHNLFPNFGRTWVREVAVPVVATLHNYRLVCAAGTLYRDGGVCTDCVRGSSLHAVRHACYRDSAVATLPLALGASRNAAADPLVRRADRLIVLSERMRQVMTHAGVAPDRMTTWPNFLPDRLRPALASGHRDGGWLFVGRLSDEKGIDRLVSRWPDGHALTVVGDGPLLGRIQDLARPGVDVRGKVSRDEVLALMGRSVGLVFPSRWYEGFPLIYPEAMAAGLPVLAFEGNTVADLVAVEGTGATATWDDDLAPTLAAAEQRFPELRERCVGAFQDHYTEAAYVRRAEALYDHLLAGAA